MTWKLYTPAGWGEVVILNPENRTLLKVEPNSRFLSLSTIILAQVSLELKKII